MVDEGVTDTEIWLQPHPWTSLTELCESLENRTITATPRLGVRDEHHPKGYRIGQRTRLKLFDREKQLILSAEVVITELSVQPLKKLKPNDLETCGPSCRTWREVHKILGFFERRVIHSRESVTVVRFAYL